MLIMENRWKHRFILKMFIAFLKKENVYEQYLKNSYPFCRTTNKVIEVIILRIQKNPTDLLLTFWWNSSVEGCKFWNNIDTKWRKNFTCWLRTRSQYNIARFGNTL